ncbi:TPA: substrate-binding domain-containing protein [Photobacterium damselae]
MTVKPKLRPTLNDVAQKVGVTKMTVSRYLRDPNSVAENTRKKIAVVIDELGYVASRVPDILSNRNSKAIGILLPSLSNQVFASLLQGIESVTKDEGYQTLITHYGYSAEEEEEKIASLLSYHVDGLILTESIHSQRTYKMIDAAAIPVVETIDLPEKPIDMVVGLDHKQAAFELVSKMIIYGRRHIVYFAARLDRRTQLRGEGYLQAMEANGLTPQIVSTQEHSSFTQGRELMRQALKQFPELDGVFCTNDDLAIGAMMHCQEHNIKIPDRVAIAGYNALDIGKAISPTLASVNTPREEIGAAAATLLLKKLSGKKVTKPIQNIGYSLYLGESLGKPV